MTDSPTINRTHGRIFFLTGSDPAAGEEISVVVPARRRWIVHSIRFSFTTIAGGAARVPQLVFDDGTTVFTVVPVTAAHVAATTIQHNFSSTNLLEYIVGTELQTSIPPLPLFAGCRIQTATVNINAADNYGPPKLLIEEWLDPQ